MLLDPNESGRALRPTPGTMADATIWAMVSERMPPEIMAATTSPARRVQALREWQGLSQVDLADLSGLAETQIARAERGCDTSPAVWRGIARALHVGEAVIRRGAERGPGF